MAFFGSKSSDKPVETEAKQRTIIGKGMTVKGDMEGFGVIRNDGTVIGNIRSKSKVFLGQGSKLQGNLTAQNAEIEGEIKGDLKVAEILTLKATAIINGNITAAKMITEPGSVFNGQARIGENAIKGDIMNAKNEHSTSAPKAQPQGKPTT